MNEKLQDKEFICIGSNIYIISKRVPVNPNIKWPTDNKLIALYQKQYRCPYTTVKIDDGHYFADGPFSSRQAAVKWCEKNGFSYID